MDAPDQISGEKAGKIKHLKWVNQFGFNAKASGVWGSWIRMVSGIHIIMALNCRESSNCFPINQINTDLNEIVGLIRA
jgi:hypothetical protein